MGCCAHHAAQHPPPAAAGTEAEPGPEMQARVPGRHALWPCYGRAVGPFLQDSTSRNRGSPERRWPGTFGRTRRHVTASAGRELDRLIFSLKCKLI